jgi:hypothetical protein
MNKERYNQIIDEAYENYNKEIIRQREIQKEEVNRLRSQGKRVRVSLIELLTKEEFINKIKTDIEFSKRWGLKIEERELSLEERKRIYEMEYTNDIEVENNHWLESKLKTRNIPTKLITVTYQENKIEVYE